MNLCSVQTLLLSGQRNGGKSTILRKYADAHGYVYQQIDCLYQLNLTNLAKTIEGLSSQGSGQDYPYQVIELTHFEHFGKIIDQGGQNQNKDARDLAEMRLVQVFEQSLKGLEKSITRGRVVIAITVERTDKLPEFL